MYGFTANVRNKFSAQEILSMIAYVRRHWVNVLVSPSFSPSWKDVSRFFCKVLVMSAIRQKNEIFLIIYDINLISGCWYTINHLVILKMSKDLEMWIFDAYRSYLFHQRMSFTLCHIKLELIKIACNSFDQMSCWVRAAM